MIKKLLLIFVLIQSVLFAQTAPNLIISDLDGTTHNLYDYIDEGKTVILDFFIINCTSCQDGAPHLDSFWDNYGPNGTDQIQVISIEVSNTSDQQVSTIAEEWGIENPVVNLLETPTAYNSFISGYPTYIIICPDKSMTALLDFNYPETILAWEQNINRCVYGENFTDVNIFANDIVHCEEYIQANLDVGNTGTTTVSELSIDVFIDSTYQSTIIWNHLLAPNTNSNSTPFPIQYSSSEISGEFIEFYVSTDQDINQENNRDSHDLSDGKRTTHSQLTIEIGMDNYPDDLSWSLTNSTGDIIIEGIGEDYEAYEEFEIITYLDLNDCYTFTILDSYGDGLCCNLGNGYFNILSNEDTLISGVNFNSYYKEAFYVGDQIGVEENLNSQKRIATILYFNLMGQSINRPIKRGVYLQQTLFEDGSFRTKKIILTNTKL